VIETLDLFFQQADITLKEIELFIVQKDFDKLFQKAHLLRGSSGSIGFTKIFKLCADLESFAKNNSSEKLIEVYKNIVYEFADSKQKVINFKLTQ
jgi:HPt (histidine-containing phosphotransfer) domain-containing protein